MCSQNADRQARHGGDGFEGLSSEQMARMLHQPFTSVRLVLFPEVLESQPNAPILQLFSLLIAAIGDQGLKPTAKSNLPRNFCRDAALAYWDEKTHQERTRYGGINREEDFFDLHVTRLVAELAGLIRKYKGRFILSRDCRRLLAEGGLAVVYSRLFKAYAEQFNWSYRDGYADLRFIQQASLFTLYLLTRHGDTWRSQTFYEDAFLQAFPIVLNDVPPSPLFTAEEDLRRCYTWRTLVDFVGSFGLAEVETVSDDILCHEYRVKTLPLLGNAVQFQLSKINPHGGEA
ncbi:hypothetical protein D7I39_13685 [Allopusillimonas ginsengisoli]|nr:hypothetical protein D7I39_13685 [Allopusillimonas ginsengisoli]